MIGREIVDFATGLKNTYHTCDPFEIAKIFGISIMETGSCPKWFKAHAVKFEGYAPYIAINKSYSDNSKKILCAHELGHVFLHDDTVNNFADVGGNINMEAEYEANLFTLALLEEQDILCVNMEDIPAYLLQSIMEDSIEVQ